MFIEKQNNFSRSLSNNAKMGAYYTDCSMSRRIGYLFSFPEDTEVSVLEPSIGDASALREIIPEERRIKVFGVELNTQTCEEYLKNNAFIDYYLNADFLNGVKISHQSFGFCFANPPYGQDELKNRLEQKFVEKLQSYLKIGAPLALVIPYYVAKDKKFLKSYMSKFQPLALYKFDDKEYQQFQQVVLVGIRKGNYGISLSTFADFYESIQQIEMIPYLPKERSNVIKTISAVSSNESDIEYFTSLEFNRADAGENLYRSALFNRIGSFCVPHYAAENIGRPPVPLKKDLLYLLAIAGGGQGIVGSEDNHDLHLQRGVAKVIKKSDFQTEDDSDKVVVVEKSYTQISLNIIQNDGSITVLE